MAWLPVALVAGLLMVGGAARAQVSTLSPWTPAYSGTATTVQNVPFTLPASPTSSGKRLFVLAIASARGGTTAGTRTVNVSYGGQPFTLATGDMDQAGIVQHTAIYHLDEAGIAAAADDQLSIQVSNGTTALTTVWTAVYDNVDQNEPIVQPRNGFTSGTTTATNISFDPPFSLDPGDLAIKAICSNHTTLRNITNIGAGWEDPQTETGGTNPTRNAVSQREIALTASDDAATTTFNAASRLSVSGAVVNGLRTTTTTLQGPVVPSSGFGVPVTFTATVEPNTVGGLVEFFDDGQPIGTVPLIGGATRTADFTTAQLRGGAHSITARYVGDAAHRSSLSNAVAHQVDPVEVSDANTGNGFHPDLASAIAAIGTVGQAGANVVVTLHDDLLGAAAIATIPLGDWDGLLIRPIGERALSASTNGPVITLNGARRVVIDGIGHAGADRLTINNPNTGTSANAIRFVNDASNNTVRSCTLRGAALPTGTAQPGAVVAFWTGTVTGNDDNTIAGCRIRNANLDPFVHTTDDLLPRRAIYSAGSGGTTNLGPHNSGNRILDNWIFNHFSANASPGRGLLLGSGNHQWTIQGNRFFQEAPREFTVNDGTHRIIDVDGSANTHASAGAHTIRENVLGFASGDGTGTHAMSGSTGAQSNVFRAISFDVPNTGPRSVISANVIDGIHHSSYDNSTSAALSPITLIYINSGEVDADSNRIGGIDAATATVRLINSSAASLHAIFNNTGTNLRTRGNRIGGIAYPNSSFYALRSNGGGTWNCAHNEIGGNMTGIRSAPSQADRTLAGIGAGGGILIADSNTIRNLRIDKQINAHTGPVVRGIEMTGGGPHIVTGNTIHDLTATKSGTHANTLASQVTGIYSTRAVTATRNSIRRLAFFGPGTAVNPSPSNDLPMNATIRGIWTNGTNAHLTAIGNVIDSLQINLPDVPDAGKRRYQVHGIRTEGNGVVVVARSNRISRLRVNEGHSVNQPSSTWTADSANTRNGALMGINIAQGLNTTLDSNQVYDLENTGTANLQVYATGIRVASTGTNIVSRNLVHTIRATQGTGTNAIQSHGTGIWMVGGNDNTLVNNMVRLGVDADGTPENIGYRARGLWVAVPTASPNRTVRLWHNSVYIGGVGTTASAQTSHGLFSVNNTVRDYRNNILWNARSIATSGAGAHYAMEIGNVTANLTSDYNALRATGTSGTVHLVRGGTTNHTTLADWQGTGRDANSFIEDPNFVNAEGNVNMVDLHILLPSPINATGTLIASVVDDIDGEVRALLTPVDIGADAVEYSVLPVELLGPWAEAVQEGELAQVLVRWTTLSEENSDRFVVERSGDGHSFRPIGNVRASGWSRSAIDYRFVDTEPLRGVNYYRLRQEDLDGSHAHSRVVAVTLRGDGGLRLWPNPTMGPIMLDLPALAETVQLHDAAGRLVATLPLSPSDAPTIVQLGLDGIQGGVYLLRVMDGDGRVLGHARLVKR